MLCIINTCVAGCDDSFHFFLQEAKQLSSLHDVMASHGVSLHAVVHETLGAEEFKPFIKGDVYYDPEVNY